MRRKSGRERDAAILLRAALLQKQRELEEEELLQDHGAAARGDAGVERLPPSEGGKWRSDQVRPQSRQRISSVPDTAAASGGTRLTTSGAAAATACRMILRSALGWSPSTSE